MSPRTALAAACGFLAGVVLVIVLGGTPATTDTETVTRTVSAAITNGGTVIVTTAVPDVTGQPLDVAKKRLERARFEADVVEGGGAFGVLVEDNWRVTAQEPGAGAQLEQGSTVRLTIERR